MEEKEEVELRDAFGKPYTVYALPRAKIVEILENLDIGDIVKEAYRCYCPDLAKGVAQLCIEDGKLTCGTYTTGTCDIQGMHYIDLYTIHRNPGIPQEDLYESEEVDLCYEKYDGDFEELRKNEGIDLQERERDALIQFASDEIRSDDWWRRIEEYLDAIYGGEEE